MDNLAVGRGASEEFDAPSEQRAAKRFTSLIRAAKLISSHGEFVCVLRDVSSSGIRLRCFHQIPRDEFMALQLGNGDMFEIQRVRTEGLEASFTFDAAVPVERLIRESWDYPRRQLRLGIVIPLTVRTIAGRFDAITENLSQQGCRIDCSAAFAMNQPAYLESSHLRDIRAKVRWRKDHHYGLVFDNTYSLRDFALLAASAQCPGLLSD